MDEIADAVDRLAEFGGAVFVREDRLLSWQWPTVLKSEDMAMRRARATLGADGHFMLHVEPDMTGPMILVQYRAVAYRLYMQIVRRWSAIHADLERGIVRAGVTAVLVGRAERRRLRILTADPARLNSRTLRADELEPLLFVESCRQFVYSTTDRYRQFGQELIAAREQAGSGLIDQAESLSITANQRVEDIRTVGTRLKIAVQVLEARLDAELQPTGAYRQDLADLALVAEHMLVVWQMLERNFDWVVEHIKLRVSIAERSATRSFTAAIFAVAVVALMLPVIAQSLYAEPIHWAAYRITMLAITSLGVLTLSYLLFLLFRKVVR
jgi:hypothetical protein